MTSETANDTISAEPAPPPATPHSHLPVALRSLGAVLLVGAASTFLFRTWGAADDVHRYLLLLGQLCLVTISGFVCGLRVRERRGARTFLSLVVAIVPVHFAVLGGVLYSQLALDAPLSDLPGYAIWRAKDVGTAIGLTLGAQLLLVPATFIAMLTLARPHARVLTAAFLGVNALLLLPLRGADTMALVVALATPALLFLQLRVLAGGPDLHTPLGRYARAMLIVPLLVLVGRTIMHYPASYTFSGGLTIAGGLSLFAWVTHLARERADDGLRPTQALGLLQAGGVAASVAGWLILCAGSPLLRDVWNALHPALWLGVVVIPCSAALWLSADHAVGHGRWYRRLAATGAAVPLALHPLLGGGLLASLVCMLAGAAIATLALRDQLKGVLGLGVLTGLLGVVTAAVELVRLETLTHWATLTGLGVVLIFTASFLERNRKQLAGRLTLVQEDLRGWQY